MADHNGYYTNVKQVNRPKSRRIEYRGFVIFTWTIGDYGWVSEIQSNGFNVWPLEVPNISRAPFPSAKEAEEDAKKRIDAYMKEKDWGRLYERTRAVYRGNTIKEGIMPSDK